MTRAEDRKFVLLPSARRNYMTKLISVAALTVAISASVPCGAIPLCGANSDDCRPDSYGIDPNKETTNLGACDWFAWSADPHAQGCETTPCESPMAESCAQYIGSTLYVGDATAPAPTLLAWAIQALGLGAWLNP